jgi:photosystem II stability/assembly factor-like uncharacterized protein
MKILLLVSVILTLAYPQTAEWLNPHPTGAELRKVKVLSNGTIHAGGEGMTFLTSKDSGRTWSVQTVSATKGSRINGISFSHPDTGWLCSSTGELFKSVDAGKSFTLVHQFPGRDLGDIFSSAFGNIVVCADSGKLFRSSDAGINWSAIQSPATQWLYSIAFLDSTIGVACGDNGVVLKTINAGAKWSLVNIGGTTVNMRGIHAKNDTIVMSSSGGALFASVNKGESFTTIATPEAGGSYNSIVFAGNKTIYTGTNMGRAYRSTNFAAGWTLMPSKTGATNWLFGVDASSPAFAAFVGRAGTVLITRSGKDSLLQTPNFTSETFRVIQRVGRTIFAGGIGGVLFRSTDNGVTWKTTALPSGVQTMSCMKLISTRVSVIAGAAGKINFSGDAGETWTGQTYGTSRFWGIDVKNNLGLAVNTIGNVYRSTNNGLSWSLASSLGNIYLYSVSIADSVTAYLCTGQQEFKVYKTTDAGSSWFPVFDGRDNLFGITFVNATNGIVIGDKGQIFITQDAGTTWIEQRQDSLIDLRAVTWYDKTIVAGGLNGVILRSTDNGETFHQMNSPTGSTIFSVDMSAPVNGSHYILAAGESGNMFRFAYSATEVDQRNAVNDIPSSYELQQNYPNPFNPATKIQFTIPQTLHVRLTVFDVLGREMRTLIDAETASGTHTIEWDGRDGNRNAVGSGMYLYRIDARQNNGGEAGSFTMVKRMLLIK